MANISEISEFTVGVHELAITDPVEGGTGGIANAQAQALANRTLFLKDALDAIFPQYCVREVDVPAVNIAAYKTANFNTSGLGKTGEIWEGYALCNGANGTRDRGGRTSVGDGNGYTVGSFGGSKDAVVVSHSHSFQMSGDDNDSKAGVLITTNDTENVGFNGRAGDTYKSLSTEGVSGTDKNMQPYIVTLFLMKL